MRVMQTSTLDANVGISRWGMAAGFAAAIILFLSAHYTGLSELRATALNDITWWLASLVAALACFRTAQHVPQRERRAWQMLGAACGAWLIGQGVWTYYEVVLGQLPAFPHWMQLFFSLYDWLFIAGVWLFPQPADAPRFTPRHIGNLALIVCALGVAFIVALLEPASLPIRNPASNAVVVLHCIGLAVMFISALYLLWSYRWQRKYWPLVFLVLGAGIHTATYITYIHQVMIGVYVANDWLNVSWLFVFGAYACGAHERLWQEKIASQMPTLVLQHRERWLEAIIPALLIAIMLAMSWFYREWLTPRAAGWATVLALLFALALGLREIWIQRQEQRLLSTLSDVNEGMLAVNRELSNSEARYRTLNMELEHRVTERTLELQQAYRELENFSYAVAHDLKAPLRSIDGFGSMLAESYGDKLDDTGQRYLQRMRRSAIRMSELIDDLLAYARVDRRELQFTRVDVSLLIKKLVTEQHDDIERCGAQVQVDADGIFARADEDGLAMACRNLLQNALKFSRDAKPPSIFIHAELHDNGVRIAFRDNGIGFDMTHHEQIFEMFQRLHRAEEIPGTGIGLAIVRKAVERMGGRVWAQSQPGEGATFFLQLPSDSV